MCLRGVAQQLCTCSSLCGICVCVCMCLRHRISLCLCLFRPLRLQGDFQCVCEAWLRSCALVLPTIGLRSTDLDTQPRTFPRMSANALITALLCKPMHCALSYFAVYSISGGMQAMQEHALHSHNALGGAVKTFSLGKTLTLGSPLHFWCTSLHTRLRALRSCDLPISTQMHHFSPTQQETFVFNGFMQSQRRETFKFKITLNKCLMSHILHYKKLRKGGRGGD